VTAEKGGHTCQTAVNGPDDVARLVITIPPRVDIAIVNISTVPTRPRPGDFVRFNVTVTGPGEWMMVDAFLAVNGTRYPQTLGFGPADGNRSFLIDWQTVVAGKYNAEVRLDPQNGIHETNETNNNMTRDFVVSAPPAPPAGFSWPLAGFSALIVVLFVVVVLSGLRGGRRKPRPPENGGI
jgi:hypothetical protein